MSFRLPSDISLFSSNDRHVNDENISYTLVNAYDTTEIFITRKPYQVFDINNVEYPYNNVVLPDEPWSTHWLDVLFQTRKGNRVNPDEYMVLIDNDVCNIRYTCLPSTKFNNYWTFKDIDGIFFQAKAFTIDDSSTSSTYFFKLTGNEINHLEERVLFNDTCRRAAIFNYVLKN